MDTIRYLVSNYIISHFIKYKFHIRPLFVLSMFQLHPQHHICHTALITSTINTL